MYKKYEPKSVYVIRMILAWSIALLYGVPSAWMLYEIFAHFNEPPSYFYEQYWFWALTIPGQLVIFLTLLFTAAAIVYKLILSPLYWIYTGDWPPL
jgi:hypothetical protein